MTTFKTRARTLDMLGRQQIAGIPTAISELFKNAHDAYADRVEIDYYRSDGLFVLRDDGMGMSREDFISRWLTIGTESKLDIAGSKAPQKDPGKEKRPMLGEKGIGRLAIATIGPQVLVLTRARSTKSCSDLTVAFVNWSLFECPGVDLDDIQIPIRTFPGGELPSAVDVSQMVAEFRENNDYLSAKIGKEFRSRLEVELGEFRVDPQHIDSYLRKPSLCGAGSGTHFIILPSSDLIPDDIDGEQKINKATPLTKALLGFTNTMTPSHSPPLIHAAFRDHKTDEAAEDLIAEGEFFTPKEFEDADHQVIGRFDEYGQFNGSVSIYGQPVDNHVITWPGAAGNPTRCGPFTISFAAIEGEGKHSTLPHDDHAFMSQKMGKIGGLYIYRDGIRILPYGDTDYDWLDIEYHRTKSAYYYYFSHRKMFGVIEIDGENNAQLSEKAGREGFRENRAYRQFKSILKNFFIQMVADFFRKEGMHSDRFEEKKAELGKMELDRRRRESLVSVKKAKLAEELDWFFGQVSADAPQKESLELSQDISEKLRNACSIDDPQRAAQEVIRVEQHAGLELQKLESRYRIARPRIALSKSMQKDWHDYVTAFSSISENVFRQTRELIEDIVEDEAAKAQVEIDRRLRTEASLGELAKHARHKTRADGASVKKEADKVAKEIRNVTTTCINEVEAELRAVLSEFQRTDVTELADEDFVEMRDILESRIQKVTEDRSNLLNSLLEQLDMIDFQGETTTFDQLVAVEQRNLLLEEEAEADLQLAQLGMAVEIINHEFNATVRSLRNNLRRLKAWADVNEDLEKLYLNIRASFDHLDGYLTLFTPLQRRLYRKAVEIRGSKIYEFLGDLFQERFTRHHIEFVRTEAFFKMRITGFPSSFYPVFVNLVDNAVFWLSQVNTSVERRIELDATERGLLISDNGPGVAARDREAIFEFGFTRKPGGRGMGLHISREVLRRVDYDLILAEQVNAQGATFVIHSLEPVVEEIQP